MWVKVGTLSPKILVILHLETEGRTQVWKTVTVLDCSYPVDQLGRTNTPPRVSDPGLEFGRSRFLFLAVTCAAVSG